MRIIMTALFLALVMSVSNVAYAATSCSQALVSKGWQAWAFTVVETGATGKLMVEIRPNGRVNVRVQVDSDPSRPQQGSNTRWGAGDGFVQVLYNTRRNPDTSQPYKMTLRLNESCQVQEVSHKGGGINVRFR